MLQEVKDLQNRAVTDLVSKIKTKDELTFRAPTGSGKTYMMADFMDRVLADKKNQNIVFLVSTLSKGGLAKQNYQSFVSNKEKGIFTNIESYLINTESSNEERFFIPTDKNVYILPRDLYRKKAKLMQGVMADFLTNMTGVLFGKNKQIYLIKDECHVATNNLDELSKAYFTKTINFSATPEIKRGQSPDIEITDEEAVDAKLIKHVEFGKDTDTVEDAIFKFEREKTNYRNSLGVNPCMIIQISNKDKADQEWHKIHTILNKVKHQSLKWMVIVDKTTRHCDTNDSVIKTSSIEKWKDYAKSNESTIDIIIFKMVISEGWDIPRAYMLYQVRDTTSKQLDEQVMGRVRRNPRLLDFETLDEKAKNLATKAWVWGIKPDSFNKIKCVELYKENEAIKQIQLKTVRLKNLTNIKKFDVSQCINSQKNKPNTTDIFTLYRNLQNSDLDIQKICYNYANNYTKWFDFNEKLDTIKKEYNKCICNYANSMEIDKDDKGNDKLISFPVKSSFVDNGNYNNIDSWLWLRKDKNDTFSFDSEAERQWASILYKLSNANKIQKVRFNKGLLVDEQYDDNIKYLWGKNFITNSEIRYEYYLNGIHSSYPDFILKDTKGKIHIFEVKSINKSKDSFVDYNDYNAKIKALKECYKQCSKLLDYNFYLPLLTGSTWEIKMFINGNEQTITENQLEQIIDI